MYYIGYESKLCASEVVGGSQEHDGTNQNRYTEKTSITGG